MSLGRGGAAIQGSLVRGAGCGAARGPGGSAARSAGGSAARSAGGQAARSAGGQAARSAGGWTLLECLVALAVLAIACAAVVPSASSALAAVRLRTAALQVAAAIARSRSGALTEGRTWQLRLTGPAAFEVGALGAPAMREVLPPGAAFDTGASRASVRFSASGVADNATLVLRVGERRQRVVVNQRGRITLD
jgi:prepilin-type N-terminal cleavage/methylation domain-containing protein